MWRVTVKNLLAHKLRLLATSSAILLGVAFVAGALSLSSTLNKTFDDLFAGVYKNVDVVVRAPLIISDTPRPSVDASLLAEVRAVEGVVKAEGYIEGYAQVVGRNGEPVGGNGPPTFGAGWIDDRDLNPFLIAQGRQPLTSDEVVLDRATAEEADVSIDDRITVLTSLAPRQYELVGVATFGDVDSPGGANHVFFTPQEAVRQVGEPGRFDDIPVVGRPDLSQGDLRDRVQAAIGDRAEVITGDDITEESQEALKDALSFIGLVPLVFAGITLFVGAFIINNVFSILLAQRSREMALLRAIGARRRQVLASVVAEALAVGLLSSLLGILAGLGVARLLIAGMGALGFDLPKTDVVLEPTTVVAGFVLGLGITLLASLLPALRASRIPPLAALRESSTDRASTSKKRVGLGLLAGIVGAGSFSLGLFAGLDRPYIYVGAGAALMFLGVYILGPTFAAPLSRALGWPLPRMKGVTGNLARENAMRNPRRTASTAAALTIGVTVVTLVSVFTQSVKASISEAMDKSLSADFILVPATRSFDGGLSPTLAHQLADLPEVGTSASQRGTFVETPQGRTFLTAVDSDAISSVTNPGVTGGDFSRLDDGGVALQERYAVDNDLRLGDILPMTFPEGGRAAFPIVAIYEGDNVLNTVAIGINTYDDYVSRQFDALVFVNRAQGVSAEQARAAIERVAAQYSNVRIQDQTEFKDSLFEQIDTGINIIYVLLALSLIVALIGIVTTLGLSVFERIRELGLLRAVGMTRRQVRSMVRWEAVILSLFGAVIGLVLGTIFGSALIQALKSEGINTLSIPVLNLAIIAIAAAVAGVLAAVWPARRAARLDILKAIATD